MSRENIGTERETFVELRVQRQDTPDSISCTGSGFCAEVLPDLLELDEAKNMCAVRGGTCLKAGGVEYSVGPVVADDVPRIINAIVQCDSEALYLVDIDGISHGSANGHFA